MPVVSEPDGLTVTGVTASSNLLAARTEGAQMLDAWRLTA